MQMISDIKETLRYSRREVFISLIEGMVLHFSAKKMHIHLIFSLHSNLSYFEINRETKKGDLNTQMN